MGRLRRNKEMMTTIAVTWRFKDLIEKEKMRNETMAQRLAKIYTLYKNNDSAFWYEQYEKVKSELLAIKNQEPWWLKND